MIRIEKPQEIPQEMPSNNLTLKWLCEALVDDGILNASSLEPDLDETKTNSIVYIPLSSECSRPKSESCHELASMIKTKSEDNLSTQEYISAPPRAASTDIFRFKISKRTRKESFEDDSEFKEKLAKIARMEKEKLKNIERMEREIKSVKEQLFYGNPKTDTSHHPNSPRRLRVGSNDMNLRRDRANSMESFSAFSTTKQQVGSPHGRPFKCLLQSFNLGGFNTREFDHDILRYILKEWNNLGRQNNEKEIMNIVTSICAKCSCDLADEIYENFVKSKDLAFLILKFLHHKKMKDTKHNDLYFEYIFYCLQEVNFIMYDFLVNGIRLEKERFLSPEKFFKNPSKTQEKITLVCLDNNSTLDESIYTLPYKLHRSSDNDYFNAFIIHRDFEIINSKNLDLGPIFKNSIFNNWKNLNTVDFDTLSEDERNLKNQLLSATQLTEQCNYLNIILLKHKTRNLKISIVNSHHPRWHNKSFQKILRLWTMYKVVQEQTIDCSNVIIAGDFNMEPGTDETDFLETGKFSKEFCKKIEFLELPKSLFNPNKDKFIDYNKQFYSSGKYYTQSNDNEKKILDYILIKSDSKDIINESGIYKPSIFTKKFGDCRKFLTDHTIVKVIFELQIPKPKFSIDADAFIPKLCTVKKNTNFKVGSLDLDNDPIPIKMDDKIKEHILKNSNIHHKYKKAMCKHMENKGLCNKQLCSFAHDENERKFWNCFWQKCPNAELSNPEFSKYWEDYKVRNFYKFN